MGEHGSKLRLTDYLKGLFSGDNNLFHLWVSPFLNAGFFAVFVVALGVDAVRRLRALSREEELLWLVVLAYLVVFSLPSKRSPSYVLTAMPALAVLIGLRWETFPRWAFRVAAVLGLLGFVVGLYAAARMQGAGILDPHPLAIWIVLLAGVALALASLARDRIARLAMHPIGLLFWLGLSLFLWPFETGRGSFGPEAVAAVRDRELHMPSGWNCRYERYYYILAPARVHGYDPKEAGRVEELLAEGKTVGMWLPFEPGGEPPSPEGCRVLGRRVDMRTRHSGEEIRQMIFDDRLDLFFKWEVLLEPSGG